MHHSVNAGLPGRQTGATDLARVADGEQRLLREQQIRQRLRMRPARAPTFAARGATGRVPAFGGRESPGQAPHVTSEHRQCYLSDDGAPHAVSAFLHSRTVSGVSQGAPLSTGSPKQSSVTASPPLLTPGAPVQHGRRREHHVRTRRRRRDLGRQVTGRAPVPPGRHPWRCPVRGPLAAEAAAVRTPHRRRLALQQPIWGPLRRSWRLRGRPGARAATHRTGTSGLQLRCACHCTSCWGRALSRAAPKSFPFLQ